MQTWTVHNKQITKFEVIGYIHRSQNMLCLIQNTNHLLHKTSVREINEPKNLKNNFSYNNLELATVYTSLV